MIIISRSMARAMFPDGRAVGQRIRSWRDENLYREIVGVVGDVRYWGLTDGRRQQRLRAAHAELVAVADARRAQRQVPPETLVRSVRAAIWSVDRKLPWPRSRRSNSGGQEHGLCRASACSCSSSSAPSPSSRRGRHLRGDRVCRHAAHPRDRHPDGAGRVQGHGRRDGHLERLPPVGAGVAIGIAAAFGVTRVFASLLFEVEPTDATTFAIASLLLLAVAMLAACIPAARAARIDPVTTLRCE